MKVCVNSLNAVQIWRINLYRPIRWHRPTVGNSMPSVNTGLSGRTSTFAMTSLGNTCATVYMPGMRLRLRICSYVGFLFINRLTDTARGWPIKLPARRYYWNSLDSCCIRAGRRKLLRYLWVGTILDIVKPYNVTIMSLELSIVHPPPLPPHTHIHTPPPPSAL